MSWTEPPPPPSGIAGVRRGQVLQPGHRIWQRWDDPAVWGTMAGFGRHNPFLGDHDPEAGERWQKHSGTHGFWQGIGERAPEIRAAAQAAVHREVRTARTAIAMSSHALGKVLHDGRVKSGFETGRNFGGDLGSGYYLGLRRGQEGMHFGYPGDHPAEGRPVYGYLTHDVFADRDASPYGEHTLVLSPSIHHRVTWSADDTLNERDFLRPSPKTAPRLSSVPTHRVDMSAGSGRDLGLGRYLGSHDHRGSYLEAQIHGGLPLHHVHYAILRSPQASAMSRDGNEEIGELKEHLNDHGVPWVHITGHSSAGPEHAVAWDDGRTRRHKGALMAAHAAIAAGAFHAGHRADVRWHQGDTRYLIELDAPGARGLPMGQVADIEWGRLYQPQLVDSVLARGYWEMLEHPVDAADVLARVRPVG